MTDERVVSVARSCRFLRDVNLTKCVLLTDQAVQELCTHCPELTSINASYCSALTDAAFAIPAAALTTVNVDGTNLTGSFAHTVLQHARNLSYLSCGYCPNLAHELVDALVAVPTRLIHLSLSKTGILLGDFVRLSLSMNINCVTHLYMCDSSADTVVVDNFLVSCPLANIFAHMGVLIPKAG